MELIVENVRCFTGRHVAPLAPITILVGENSSGKSTLVAMARLAWDAMSRWDLIDFNEDPFRLGAFDDIVSTSSKGRAETFAVGFRFPPREVGKKKTSAALEEDVEVRVVFSGMDAQPAVREWTAKSGKYTISHRQSRPSAENVPVLTLEGPLTEMRFTARDLPMAPSIFAYWRNWNFFRMRMTSEAKEMFGAEKGSKVAQEDLDAMDLMLSSVGLALSAGRPYASAPIRTKPTRTYDPLTDKPSPEGGHVPMMLAKLLSTSDNRPARTTLHDELRTFGSASGLFRSINVKRMGGDEANLPFQIRIGVDEGPEFNLVDVGYGVSQVLPIIVDALQNKNRMLLLQQPEVHLHPRAQAELGSFLARLATQHQSAPILIETHSDYLIDRIRMDIRDRKGVDGRSVVILHCDRTANGVSINPILIDDLGNLINAPATYRQFFLEEERRFLQG